MLDLTVDTFPQYLSQFSLTGTLGVSTNCISLTDIFFNLEIKIHYNCLDRLKFGAKVELSKDNRIHIFIEDSVVRGWISVGLNCRCTRYTCTNNCGIYCFHIFTMSRFCDYETTYICGVPKSQNLVIVKMLLLLKLKLISLSSKLFL